MKNILSLEVTSLEVHCDYETSERCGAGGFQVYSVIANTELGELDLTSLIDQGKHYSNLCNVARDLGLDDVYIESC